jgi:hypothetical protein
MDGAGNVPHISHEFATEKKVAIAVQIGDEIHMFGKFSVGSKEVPRFRIHGKYNCSFYGLTVTFEENSLDFIEGEGLLQEGFVPFDTLDHAQKPGFYDFVIDPAFFSSVFRNEEVLFTVTVERMFGRCPTLL